MATQSATAPLLLIADDNPDDRLLLQEAWGNLDSVHLHLVQDGQALTDFLAALTPRTPLDGDRLPDLILLDLRMPRKDGFEVLKDLKSNSAWQQIPIVVMTTSQDQTDIARAYRLGANSCIVKPQTFDGLLEVTATLHKYWFSTVCLPPESENN